MSVIPRKGDLVRLSKLKVRPAALAGVQLKFEGYYVGIEGVVAHVRGDHPTAPTTAGVWLRDDERFKSDPHVDPALRVTCEKCGKVEIGPLDLQFLTACMPVES